MTRYKVKHVDGSESLKTAAQVCSIEQQIDPAVSKLAEVARKLAQCKAQRDRLAKAARKLIDARDELKSDAFNANASWVDWAGEDELRAALAGLEEA